MDRAHVDAWMAGYERAWRSPGTDALAELFTPDATYQQAPFHGPVVGLAAIAEMWETEREGPDEVFHLNYEIVAVDPAESVAVVRVDVEYGEPVEQEWADLWVVRFGPGRAVCRVRGVAVRPVRVRPGPCCPARAPRAGTASYFFLLFLLFLSFFFLAMSSPFRS